MVIMPDFRRYYIPDSIVFITNVTAHRIPILHIEGNLSLYWDTLKNVRLLYPFHLLAYVILPDHFHWLMQIDDHTGNFSKVLHSFKRNFSRNYLKEHSEYSNHQIWQARFWDHIIRDEKDLSRHFDYIHWNPVKHGYVQTPDEWLPSSFGFWKQKGIYSYEWGSQIEPSDIAGMDFE